jgi:hypothetical protein
VQEFEIKENVVAMDVRVPVFTEERFYTEREIRSLAGSARLERYPPSYEGDETILYVRRDGYAHYFSSTPSDENTFRLRWRWRIKRGGRPARETREASHNRISGV